MKIAVGVVRALPMRHETHTPPTALRPKAILLNKSGGSVRTKILYFNPESARDKYADIIRQRGHHVASASSWADAFAMMRRQIFDALVIGCAHDTLDIQNFTAKAQGLQPSLAVFLAGEWGDELATGLDELGHVLTMLEDDECARLAVESRIV